VTQVKHRTRTIEPDLPIKIKVTFGVQRVVSPTLSNILLTPFDKEMRRHGYQLTRWADDWVVTCRTRAEAQNVLVRAEKILEELGVMLNREKTRIVHIAQGFEFLGYKIQRGKGQFKLTHDRIKSKLNRQNLYAIPTQKSVDRFKDQGLDHEAYTSASGRIDRDDQPDHPRMGQLLLSLPGQETLPPAGWVDNPPAVVAPRQAVAERRLEEISHPPAACGVQAR
jgi:Reverse transcriptase (RNA-dependent DNA polymerase)